jgi:hypothetical protein
MAIDHPHHVFCLPTRFFRVPERIFLQISTACIELLKCAATHNRFTSYQFPRALATGATPNQSLQAMPSQLVSSFYD